MRVKFNSDKSVEFLDGSGTINANDVLRQTFEVETGDGVITTGESLWVVFEFADGEGFTYSGEVLFSEESGIYKMLVPQEILAIPGIWTFQLLVRLYSTTDPTRYVNQLASDIKEFTVQNGLPIEDGAPVNNATVGNLYNTAVMASKNAEANAESANASAAQASFFLTKAEESAESAAQSAAEAETIARETAETTATITAKSVAKETAEATAKETAEGVLNGKVDKITEVTGIRRVYGISQNGDQTAFDVNEDYAPESIPFRDGSGRIKVATPTEDSHAVNKGYADTNFAKLDESGKVPASQLPSYVDDVLEYATINSFPVPGESGKIYVDISTNLTYRWSGTKYTEISESLALGETSSTAYAGDKGKKNAEDIVKLQSEKLDKPILPLKPSAVVMNADGSVDTKPLLEFQEKIYDEDDNKQYTYQLKIKNGYPVLVMTEITETE